MCSYPKNLFFEINIKSYKIIINLKKFKKPGLVILNKFFTNLMPSHTINADNCFKNQIVLKSVVPLPHHLKFIYLKKKINYYNKLIIC